MCFVLNSRHFVFPSELGFAVLGGGLGPNRTALYFPLWDSYLRPEALFLDFL